jgi:hypothetical protein
MKPFPNSLWEGGLKYICIKVLINPFYKALPLGEGLPKNIIMIKRF